MVSNANKEISSITLVITHKFTFQAMHETPSCLQKLALWSVMPTMNSRLSVCDNTQGHVSSIHCVHVDTMSFILTEMGLRSARPTVNSQMSLGDNI